MNDSELMVQMADADKSVPVAGGMNSQEIKDFLDYVMGTVVEPPEVMNKIMNNLIHKLSMGLGYNVVANIGRQAQLAKFLSVAEERMFDVEEIKDMSREEISKLYGQAEKTLNGLQEFQRKFIVQNKDVLKTDTTPQEQLVSKLMTLPADKVDAVMKTIDAAVADQQTSANVPQPELSDDDFDIK